MKKFLPEAVFRNIEKNFPFSCIDIVLIENNKVLLTKRGIEPDKGKWHLPGSIIRKGESISKTVSKVGMNELGITLNSQKHVGVYEDIRQKRHTIIHCFIVKRAHGKIKLDKNATEFAYFSRIPKKIPAYQIQEIRDARRIQNDR